MQEVATAIDMILMHQEMVDPKARKPLIFVKKSENSGRIAQMLSNHTGLEVRVFKSDIKFQREKTDRWEKPVKHIKAMHDFRHLLKQTDKVRPTTKHEPKVRAVAGAHAENIPALVV
jgi:5-bromo-4-chloroindolyl phosphate hydrolysis protein